MDFDIIGSGLYRLGISRVGQPDCDIIRVPGDRPERNDDCIQPGHRGCDRLENVAISFPTAEEGTLDFGAVNLAFPSITQNVVQTQDVTHTDFAQTNEFAEFSYPFTSVGATSLPGFGFGF